MVKPDAEKADFRNLFLDMAVTVSKFRPGPNESSLQHRNSFGAPVNLRASWELDLCKGRIKAAGARHGVGAKQAPTAEPIMMAELKDCLQSGLENSPNAPALMAAWLQVVGCVRHTHVQRSKVVKITHAALHFCWLRGKQVGQRQGFLWSCPRITALGSYDV